MCGILAIGQFDNNPVDHELVIRMRDTMYHRGPDDAGIHIDGSVALAHRRLSVIDLSTAGHQPMVSADGNLVLVFNGEIYNYVELANELRARGHVFSSNSDSEVILHQYQEDGIRCLEKFNGMFGFVIWDKKAGKLFCARDRVGIKPVYYHLDSRGIIIASEIKAILEDPRIKRAPDYEGLADYIFAERPLANKTVFENINELEPGHFFTINSDGTGFSIEKYWHIKHEYNFSRSDLDVSDELYDLMDNAVELHCRSDATLGCHLSGGLDSSTIVAFTGNHRKNLDTFSIKFSEDETIDETSYAKLVAQHVEATYWENTPEPTEFIELFPTIMWHMDSPMATNGGFSYYTVSKLAKQHVKVSLTGHGGDEVFAGYPAQFKAAYNDISMFDSAESNGNGNNYSFANQVLSRIKGKSASDILAAIRRRMSPQEDSLENKWVSLHCSYAPKQNPLLASKFVDSLGDYSPKEQYLKPFRDTDTQFALDKCLSHDRRVYLPGLLHLEDRVSMALSLESRVPLLDYRLIEFMSTVPPDQKIRGMVPKHMLRQCASRVLPEEVWARKNKFAFPISKDFWSSTDMQKMMKSLIQSEQSMDRGVFKTSVLSDPELPIAEKWTIMNVELWFRIFIDQDAEWLQRVRN